LMDCLWNVCGLLGMDFNVSWMGSAAICACGQVSQAMADWEMEELYWLLLIVYILGILSGILLAFCTLKFCKGRNITASNLNSLELTVEDEAGDVIYWSITRQMYHIREKCSIYKATSMGRTARSCNVCKVCRPEIGVPVTVSSTGSKYHRRDCHTVRKSTPLELVRCPICFDIKAEWMNL
jgi:hypothetical protein